MISRKARTMIAASVCGAACLFQRRQPAPQHRAVLGARVWFLVRRGTPAPRPRVVRTDCLTEAGDPDHLPRCGEGRVRQVPGHHGR